MQALEVGGGTVSRGNANRAADAYGAGVLGHDVPTERRRLHLLEQLLDPETIRVIEGRGIGPAWRCLELGAGAGSIARWLAARCPDGRVIATDIDPRYLDPDWAPNLEVRRHDVVREGFPAASFDLVHARALLVNLPARKSVLTKVPDWLDEGGWLVVEEPALFPTDSSPYPAFRRLMAALEAAMAESHGADHRWTRRLPRELASLGLTNIGLSVSPLICGNGGPADEFWRTFFTQLAPALTRPGLLTEAEYAAGMAMFEDPSFADVPVVFVSAWGQRA
jgi:SAM-dependent methyltransferase